MTKRLLLIITILLLLAGQGWADTYHGNNMTLGLGTGLGGGSTSFSDNFTQGDGTIANGWSNVASTWTISSGSAINTPVTGGVGDNANILTDGDMEAVGTAAWAAMGGATVEKAASPVQAGSQSLHTSGGANSGSQHANFTTTRNTFYRLDMYAQKVTGNLEAYTNVGTGYYALKANAGSAGNWTHRAAAFVETANSSARYVQIYSPTNPNECYWDSVFVYPLTLNNLFLTRLWPITDVYTTATIDYSMQNNTLRGGAACAVDNPSDPKYGIVASLSFRAESATLYARLDKVVNGTWSNIIAEGAPTAVAYDTDARIGVKLSGNTASLWYGDKQVGADIDVTGIGAGKYHGLFSLGSDLKMNHAQIIKATDQRAVVVSTVSNAANNYAYTPTVIRLPHSGKMLVAYGVGTAEATGVVPTYKISANSGATWEDAVPYYTPAVGYSANGSLKLLPDGRLFCSIQEQKAVPADSYVKGMIGTIAGDDTITWGDSFVLSANGADLSGVGTSSPVLVLNNGTTFLQNIYGNNGDSKQETGWKISTDSGATWSSYVTVAVSGTPATYVWSEMYGAVLPSGRVIAIIRCDGPAAHKGYYMSYSDTPTVAGSWSAPALCVPQSESYGVGLPMMIRLTSGKIILASRGSNVAGYTPFNFYAVSNNDGSGGNISTFSFPTVHKFVNLGTTTYSSAYIGLLQLPNSDIAAAIAQAVSVSQTSLTYLTMINRDW